MSPRVLRRSLKPSFSCNSFFWGCFLHSFSFLCLLSCSHFFLRHYYSLQVYYLFKFLTDFALLLKYMFLLGPNTFFLIEEASSQQQHAVSHISGTLSGGVLTDHGGRQRWTDGRGSCPRRPQLTEGRDDWAQRRLLVIIINRSSETERFWAFPKCLAWCKKL